MCAFFAVTHGERGVDHTQVGEALWKISKRVSGFRIDFFGEKVDIVRISERRFEESSRLRNISAARQKIGLPKTAKCKGAFVPILALLVAVDQAMTRNKFLANAFVGLLHASNQRTHSRET